MVKAVKAVKAVEAETITVDAIKFVQKKHTMYLIVLSAHLLRKLTIIHRYSSENAPNYKLQGYQRVLEPKRATNFGRYLKDSDIGICPPLIANDREGVVKWDEKKRQLTLSATNLLQLIDGQHREGGIEWIRDNEGMEELGKFDVPMMLCTFTGVIDEMQAFLDINSKQARVKADLTNELNLCVAEALGEDSIDEKMIIKVVCTEATRILTNRKTGILSGRICMAASKKITPKERRTNEKFRCRNVIKSNSFSTSLAHIYKFMESLSLWSSTTYKGKALELANISGAFWDALAEVIPNAFAEPKQYVLHRAWSSDFVHQLQLEVMRHFVRDSDVPFDSSKWYFNELIDLPSLDINNIEKYWAIDEGQYGQYGTGFGASKRIFLILKKELKTAWAA